MKVAYAQILGNPQSVIYGKNPDENNTILGTSQSVICGKNIQNLQFPVIYDSFDFFHFWESPKASFLEKTSKTYNFQEFMIVLILFIFGNRTILYRFHIVPAR